MDSHLKARPNLWLGTSVATQEDADRNIPELLKCRDLCAKLFVSVEPLVGPVDLRLSQYESPGFFDNRSGLVDWVIVGGESGPHARPCNVEWIRSIVRQCKDADAACFVKQLGSLCIDNEAMDAEWSAPFVCVTEGRKVLLKDKKGGDPAEWPEDLRVREFPR